jgi:F-type H+-transporting ATPase subunit a
MLAFGLSITKSVIILGIAILMFVLFTGLAKSYTKMKVASGAGRFFEPLSFM